MKRIYISLIVLAAVLITPSCDEMLDLEPQFAQDAESYFNTPADYEQALTGAYDLLQTSYTTYWIGEIASDNSIAGGESVNDSRSLHEIDEMTHNPVNPLLQDVLRFNFAGITRANFLLENKDNIEFEGKEKLIAEAKFLRAYYYFELVKVFGAVPLIVDRRIGIEEATSIARTPASEVYAQIEQDLVDAAEVLDWKDPDKGRVTKGAALGLLGRAYLYQDKFDEAAAVLDEVINDGPFSTITITDSQGFSDLFSVAEEGNTESVFEIEYTGLEGGSYDCFVCLEGNVAVGFNGPYQYEGPVYRSGNRYNVPTQDLYDFYDPSDLRRDGSILDIEAFKAAQPNPDDISYTPGAGGHTGYYNNKYIPRQSETGLPDVVLTSPVNHRVIRYPDVLLMAAEAHNRKASPDDVLARTYLNEVRNRVGMGDITSSGTDLTNAIWAERRLELAGEGLRFFDLVRTGQAASAIDGFVAGKHELFPIPQVEIDLAGGNWEQNPMY
ncbi:MAG: RagB/SusD family nutrient uptake outer membrane protein [Cyclobacteriaceae bacterium]|nr:RagB/SusD family nutrient uptake outer membrane protein [Cyclobacteriaceae bacterium SS2]